MAVVVGNVIGSGIFLKPGTIARDGGEFGLIISVWVLGGVLCILGALCFAELATMLPRAGGLYVYLREAYGRPVAFLFGWTDFLIRLPGSIAALSVVFVGQVVYVLGWDVPTLGQLLMVAVLIIGMAWVNIIGVVWGGRLQNFTTIIKAGALVLVATSPFILWPFVQQAFDAANLTTTVDPAEKDFGARLGVILLAVMWAYNGWHGVTPLAEEINNPQRNIPIALFGGIGILIVLYVATNFAYHSVLTMDEIREVGVANADTTKSVIERETVGANMFKRMIGPMGVALVAGMIMCSTFGAINTNLLQAPRIPFAMGRDGVFFRGLGHVHEHYRTPAVAIAASALIAILFVVTAAAAKHFVQHIDAKAIAWPLFEKITASLQKDTIFDLLTNLVIFAASIFYALAVAAVFILRVRRPDLDRPYRTWGYPVVPALFIGVYVWFLYQIYSEQPLESRTGLVLILLGLPVYFAYQWSSRQDNSPPTQGNEI